MTAIDTLREGMHLQPAHVSLSLRLRVAAEAQAQRVALAHVSLSSQCVVLWLLWKFRAIPGCGGGRRVQQSETQELSNSVSRVKNHLHCSFPLIGGEKLMKIIFAS